MKTVDYLFIAYMVALFIFCAYGHKIYRALKDMADIMKGIDENDKDYEDYDETE